MLISVSSNGCMVQKLCLEFPICTCSGHILTKSDWKIVFWELLNVTHKSYNNKKQTCLTAFFLGQQHISRKYPLSPVSLSVWDCLPLISFLYFCGLVNKMHANATHFKGVLQRTFFISTNERLMYKFYKNCNYFIFK